MKKLVKVLICLILCVFAFGLTACGKKTIMHPAANDAIYSNGGLMVQKGNYLYFVNGYMSANSMSQKDYEYQLGSIKVAKLDADGNPYFDENGVLQANTVATLSTKLAGFEATNLNVCGNYLYFASPCQENEAGKDAGWAKELVVFFRVKLSEPDSVEKIYQSTSKNSELDYAYFNNETTGSCYLTVYEKSSSQIVIINTANKNKQTIKNISSITMPKNNCSTIMYIKLEDGKQIAHKLNVASGEDGVLGSATGATIKFVNESYFFFEKSNEYGGDKNLYYLPTSSNSIEDAEVCWQSVNNLTNYELSPDGKTLIGTRGNAILYKFNWQFNPDANPVRYDCGKSLNIIGTTNTNLFYYVDDEEDGTKKVIMSYNFTNPDAQPNQIATLENMNTNYFDLNEEYLYFYKTVGQNSYLHRLLLNNNISDTEQFIGLYLKGDEPSQDK